MLRTVQFACTLPKAEADALNAESGRIYTDMLVCHYRLYRKQGVWLTRQNGERLEDALGGPTTLHAHSRDAAQQGFYKACKTASACSAGGPGGEVPSLAQALPHHDLETSRASRAMASLLLLGTGAWDGSGAGRAPLPPRSALPAAAFLGSATGLGPGGSSLQAGIW